MKQINAPVDTPLSEEDIDGQVGKSARDAVQKRVDENDGGNAAEKGVRAAAIEDRGGCNDPLGAVVGTRQPKGGGHGDSSRCSYPFQHFLELWHTEQVVAQRRFVAQIRFEIFDGKILWAGLCDVRTITIGVGQIAFDDGAIGKPFSSEALLEPGSLIERDMGGPNEHLDATCTKREFGDHLTKLGASELRIVTDQSAKGSEDVVDPDSAFRECAEEDGDLASELGGGVLTLEVPQSQGSIAREYNTDDARAPGFCQAGEPPELAWIRMIRDVASAIRRHEAGAVTRAV